MKDAFRGSIVLIMLVFVANGVYVSNGFRATYDRYVTQANTKTFSTTAEGKVSVVPDVAEFSFSVVTETGKEMGVGVAENTKKLNGAIAFLKAQGVAPKDITTQQYSLNPRYQYPDCSKINPCPPPEIAGYSISQSVVVKGRDITKVGDLLSGVVKNGANSVSQFTMVIDDPDVYQAKARLDAILKAKVKAQTISDASGLKLGRLIGVEDGGVSTPPYPRPYAMDSGVMSAKAEVAPTIEPGSQDVTANVTLRYEVE